MKLNQYFKSLIDIDDTRIIICNLDHQIIYMNKKANDFYSKKGRNLLGYNLNRLSIMPRDSVLNAP